LKGRRKRNRQGDLFLILIALLPFSIRGFFHKREGDGCVFLNRCINPPVFIFAEGCYFEEIKVKDLSEIRCEGDKIVLKEIGGKEGFFFGNKIDLNEAEIDDLMAIPGIGFKIASEIIQLREKKGGFRSVEELVEVRGIGKKKLEKIKNFVFTGD